MDRFISSIQKSVESENWYAALFMALAMPDICSNFERTNSKGPGDRYRSWFKKYLLPANTREIGGGLVVFMTAMDCWSLRCSLLHEGSDDVAGQKSGQKSSDAVSRFRFTTMGAHRIRVDDILVLNTARFCAEVCQAVEAWSEDVKADAAVQERIRASVSIEHGSFSPSPGVVIG